MPKPATEAQTQRACAALKIRNPIYRSEVLEDGTIVLYVVNYRKPMRWKPRKRRARSQIPRATGGKAQT